MDLKNIVGGVLSLAESFKPLLAGTPVGAAVTAGKAVLDLIDGVKAVAATNDQPKLQAMRDELEPLVMAHLGRTIDSLG